jgi:hypothetical protein
LAGVIEIVLRQAVKHDIIIDAGTLGPVAGSTQLVVEVRDG